MISELQSVWKIIRLFASGWSLRSKIIIFSKKYYKLLFENVFRCFELFWVIFFTLNLYLRCIKYLKLLSGSISAKQICVKLKFKKINKKCILKN